MTTGITTYPPAVPEGIAREVLGGISRSRLYILKDSGAIDSVKEGKRRLWITSSLLAYIDQLEHSQPEQPQGEHL